MTSGLSGSPAATHSRSTVTSAALRSAWSSIRHTVGGAQNVVTPCSPSARSSTSAENRSWPSISTVASAFQGAKKLLQACFAQPGEEMLRWTSPGCRPIQYTVDRWPTG